MGLLLVKNGFVLAPEPLGEMDILTAETSIITVERSISESAVKALDPDATIVDAKSLWVAPGLIDSHIHFNGAGGENGPQFRTPPLELSSFIRAGITTAVAPLGTDGICRSLRELLAKSRALDMEGITAYMYTGSYSVPSVTITESVLTDITLIDKIIGTKVALADHRSSHPTAEELRRLISDSRTAGIISGKAGIVEAHMGSEDHGLALIEEALKGTHIPPAQIVPTHVNRTYNLFEDSLGYCSRGGVADITASIGGDDAVEPAECVERILHASVPLANFTMSTDGNGSMPVFDDTGDMVGMGIGDPGSLLSALKNIVSDKRISAGEAFSLVTANAAKRLKLNGKGRLEKGCDADILILSPSDLSLCYVIAKGEILMEKGRVLRFGTFEKPAVN